MALSHEERIGYMRELQETREQLKDLNFRIRQDTRIRDQLAGFAEALEVDLGLDKPKGYATAHWLPYEYGAIEPSEKDQERFEYVSHNGGHVLYRSGTQWKWRGNPYGLHWDQIPKTMFPLQPRLIEGR